MRLIDCRTKTELSRMNKENRQRCRPLDFVTQQAAKFGRLGSKLSTDPRHLALKSARGQAALASDLRDRPTRGVGP